MLISDNQSTHFGSAHTVVLRRLPSQCNVLDNETACTLAKEGATKGQGRQVKNLPTQAETIIITGQHSQLLAVAARTLQEIWLLPSAVGIRAETHERFKRTLLIGQIKTKCANFRGNPLFRIYAQHKNKQTNNNNNNNNNKITQKPKAVCIRLQHLERAI